MNHGLLRDVTNELLYNLEHADYLDLDVGLINAAAPPIRVLQWLTDTFDAQPFLHSRTARYNEFETCATGDVVAVCVLPSGWRAGRVWFHFDVASTLFTTVSLMDHVNTHPSGMSSEWRDTGRSDLIFLETISAVFIHSFVAGVSLLSTLITCVTEESRADLKTRD